MHTHLRLRPTCVLFAMTTLFAGCYNYDVKGPDGGDHPSGIDGRAGETAGLDGAATKAQDGGGVDQAGMAPIDASAALDLGANSVDGSSGGALEVESDVLGTKDTSPSIDASGLDTWVPDARLGDVPLADAPAADVPAADVPMADAASADAPADAPGADVYVPQKSKNGQACLGAGECTSGSCADGYCCDKACTGTCEACDVTPGTCATLGAGAAPRASRVPCTIGSDATCAGKCNGTSPACFYTTAACGPATSCANATLSPQGTCSAGTCSMPASQACPTNQTCSGNACACLSPKTTCGSACVDTQSDPANCNTCGHNCLGGTCSAGQCQPAVIFNPGSRPTVFGLDNSSLYYQVEVPQSAGTSSSDAYQVDKTALGKSGSRVDIGASFEGYGGVIGTKLFSSIYHGQYMCDVGSCSATKAPLPQSGSLIPFRCPSPTYFAMANPLSNSLSITWYTSTYAVVNSYSESFDGISVTSSYSSLAAFGDFVYWIRVKTDDSGPDTSLYGVSLSNLTPVHLTSNLSSGMQIIDANAWSILMLDNDGSIYRVPLPSGRTIPLFVTMLPPNILGTATEDATGVYFFDGPGTLSHCDPINCNATRSNLASGQSPTGSIYQDASALYWANSTPPAVVRLAK